MTKKIWLIGGTCESVAIATAIACQSCSCLITVTTPEAIALYPLSDFLQVKIGKMSAQDMLLFCQTQQITHIIDASHPFAVQVSRQAIAVADLLNLSYLRYERERVNNSENYLNIIKFSSFENLFKANLLNNQRVLLTIGTRYLPLFKNYQENNCLFTRLLPTQEALKIAQDSGFNSDQIMAIRPPISEALETALWQQWKISVVITKASGKAGGEDIKRKVAQKLGVKLMIIERPQIDYPRQTNQIDEIIEFLRAN